MAHPPASPRCPVCRGTGQIALLTSVVACDCRRVLSRPLAALDEDLALSVRSRRVLRDLGIATVGDLLRARPADVLEARHATRTTVAELAELLARLGFPGWGE